MKQCRHHPPMQSVDVWLDEDVFAALEELYREMGRAWAARFLLISALEYDPIMTHKVKTFAEYLTLLKRPVKHLGSQQGKKKRKRLSLRLHAPLLKLIDNVVGELAPSRSGVIRAVITRGVDERLGWGDPSLSKTLKRMHLPRRKWPWEK